MVMAAAAVLQASHWHGSGRSQVLRSVSFLGLLRFQSFFGGCLLGLRMEQVSGGQVRSGHVSFRME